jgi:hypothetical protein
MSELPDVPNNTRKEAKIAIDIIESNKLYNLNIDISDQEKNLDMEAKAWLKFTTESANDPTNWFERDLDDFLKELHRENEENDDEQGEEDEDRIRQMMSSIGSRDWTAVSRMMTDTFEKWNFETFDYAEKLGEHALLHLGFKLFMHYGLLDKFSIADSNFE